mgnify:CR=1 FL=1
MISLPHGFIVIQTFLSGDYCRSMLKNINLPKRNTIKFIIHRKLRKTRREIHLAKYIKNWLIEFKIHTSPNVRMYSLKIAS